MLRLPINAWCDWLPYLSNWEKFKNHTKKANYFKNEENVFSVRTKIYTTQIRLRKLRVKVWFSILRAKIYEGAEKWLLYSLLRLTLGNGSPTPSSWGWSNWQLMEMMSCQVALSVVMLCCVTWAHIKKKILLRSHDEHWGRKKEAGLKKKNYKKKKSDGRERKV